MVKNSGDFGQSAAAATDMYQLDPIGLLKRKFWTILFFVICSVALALLYYFQAPKTFESWAQVFIDDQRAPTMNLDEEDRNDTAVERYLEIVKSGAVLNQAISDCVAEDMKSFEDVEDILYEVRENFVATPSDTKSESGVMRLSYQCGVEEDCQKILENIMISFTGFIKQDTGSKSGSILETMSELDKERAERFRGIMKEIDTLMQKPYVQVVEGKVYNQHEGQASKLQIQLDEKAAERLEYVALGDNLARAHAAGQNIEELVIETIQEMDEAQLGGYTASHQKYLDLLVRERELAGDFGAQHPELVNVRDQIRMVDQIRREQLLSALRTSTNTNVNAQGDFYSIVSSHIANKISFFASHEAQISEAIRAAKQKSLIITKDCERLSMLLAEREMMQDDKFEAENRVREFDVLQNFDRQDVRVIDTASVAEQVAPSLPISLAAGLLLGGLLGFLFGALKEMAEKTFRSSDEVSRRLGVNVVAQIGRFSPRSPKDPEFKRISNDIVSLHRPQSPAAESFKALRTSIFFKSQSQDIKVIQVTSPASGDGKSTVSANLAVVMAQSGRRVLLIDCDLRRPSQHARFGVANKIGVSSVITGEHTIAEVTQEVGIRNLRFIASGPQYTNPAELLTTRAFIAFLEAVRTEYDFVIVDTPPVLPVTDPVIISNYVDAVYMPMRIRNGIQVNAQRAVESLAMVGTQISGIIINGLTKKESKGYNYGGYGYGVYGSRNPYTSYATQRAAKANGAGIAAPQTSTSSAGGETSNGKSSRMSSVESRN